MGFWNGRQVLVTGGAGFLGSHLVARLLAGGARVRVVDNLERAPGAEWLAVLGDRAVDFQPVDLRDADACRQACQRCEVVFHCAARAGSSGYYRTHSGRVLRENLLLDTQLLEAVLAAGVAAYFYPSSSMVYPLERQQTPEAPALCEEDALPANPPNSYGWAKLLGERAVEAAVAEHSGFRAAILRLENLYGPGQDTDLERGSIIPVLVRRALEYPRTPFELRGTGQETRCYCYITDGLDAIGRAMEALACERLVGPLNVTGEERVCILDLAQKIVRVSGKEIEITFARGETRIWGQVLDCSRARTCLGWVPRVCLCDGLRHSFASVEAQLRGEMAQPVVRAEV